MPNHQIVECYIVFTAMEAAKKSEDPDAGESHKKIIRARNVLHKSEYCMFFLLFFAAVCPDLTNHEIFELWRVEDTTKLHGNKLAKFNSHKAESNRRYNSGYAMPFSRS